MSAWQQIATAPKDGTRVLVACVGECGTQWMYVAWNKRSIWRFCERKDGSHFAVLDTPTHWMPLPAPPTAIDDETNAAPTDARRDER